MPEDQPVPPPPQPFTAPSNVPPPPQNSQYMGVAGGYPVYARPPRPPRSGWFWLGIIGGSLGLVAVLIGGMVWAVMRSLNGDTSSAIDGFGAAKIGVIDIDGVITDSDKTDTDIQKFAEDSSVKAIILHINSPGGGAAASQEIYHEVLRAKKKKPIIASVESVGASGAYYIASACDKIYANDASVVGSIGVIMEWTNYGDLMKWARLKNVVVHAGTLKDAGDPTRDMTPQEQAYFQSLVDNMYGQFVHDVATGRKTSDDTIRPLATGQVWTGEQAIDPKLHLIDKIGGFQVAIVDTAKQVGISGEPQLVKPPSDRKGLLATLTDDTDDLIHTPTHLLDQSPGFYFVWR